MKKRLVYVKGIYSISCVATGERYIGCSTDIHKRWKKHLKQLKTGKHPNYKLQALWDKWGEGQIVFNILEICRDIAPKEWLFVREQFWMDEFEPFLLNISPHADAYRYILEKRFKAKDASKK